MVVFGARVVSRAMSKVPQLVWTTAVSSSPGFTVCFGAFRLTFFGSGASTSLQPLAPPALVVDESLLLLLPPLREIRTAATTPTAITPKTIKDDPALVFFLAHRRRSLEHYYDRFSVAATPDPARRRRAPGRRPGADSRGRVRGRRGRALPLARVPAGAGPRRRQLRAGDPAGDRTGRPRSGGPRRLQGRQAERPPLPGRQLRSRRPRRRDAVGGGDRQGAAPRRPAGPRSDRPPQPLSRPRPDGCCGGALAVAESSWRTRRRPETAASLSGGCAAPIRPPPPSRLQIAWISMGCH